MLIKRQSYFVTGTDTGIGKTFFSAWLARQINASYWKPIQTGNLEGTDTETVRVQGIKVWPEAYSLKEPLSPLAAAQLENKHIDFDSLILPNTQEPIIVEGAGGVMVPITEQRLMIDLIQKFDLPVLLVASTRLGTINHTLLTVEALKTRSIPIEAIILNGSEDLQLKKIVEGFAKVVSCFLDFG